MSALIAYLGAALKSLLEVLVHELFAIWTSPDTVTPEVDPVLDSMEPDLSDDALDGNLVERFGGLHTG